MTKTEAREEAPMSDFPPSSEDEKEDVPTDLASALEEASTCLDEPFHRDAICNTMLRAAKALRQLSTETVMRVRFEKHGGHYHCRVFTAKQMGQAFAKNGDLVFDEAEWPDIPLLMRGAELVEEASEGP